MLKNPSALERDSFVDDAVASNVTRTVRERIEHLGAPLYDFGEEVVVGGAKLSMRMMRTGLRTVGASIRTLLGI